VRAGDEAVLVGPGLSIDDVAAAAGTLAYELLTSLRGTAKTYMGGR
jgi:alanine racemase